MERDATVMDDGAPTGPKTILRYFPERFRHHHADRIRHVRRPNTNKRTLAIRWRLGLTVCVWTCSRLLVCVRTCARVCGFRNTALPIVGREREAWRKRELAVSIIGSCGTTLPFRSMETTFGSSSSGRRLPPREFERFIFRQHCSLPYLCGR